MSHNAPLLGTAAHVGEHLVALSCASTVEFCCQRFVRDYGGDYHHWPLIAFAVLGVATYLVGFATAFLIGRRWPTWRERLFPNFSLPGPQRLKHEDKLAFAILGAAALVSLALVIAARRPGPPSG